MFVAECVGVGIYCSFLSIFIHQPFVLGVLKHALGYVAGLHGVFCRIRHKGTKAPVSYKDLALESLQEWLGVLGLSFALGTTPVAYFFIGVALHAVAEYIGINRQIIKRCR